MKKLRKLGKLAFETKGCTITLAPLINGKWKLTFVNAPHHNDILDEDVEVVIDQGIEYIENRREELLTAQKYQL